MAARKSRRLGIIAAFILLDKSGDGALDKNELLDFLNETAGLDFDVREESEEDHSVRDPSYYTLYIPFIHPLYTLYSRTYTYVHPLYMYIHHTYT